MSFFENFFLGIISFFFFLSLFLLTKFLNLYLSYDESLINLINWIISFFLLLVLLFRIFYFESLKKEIVYIFLYKVILIILLYFFLYITHNSLFLFKTEGDDYMYFSEAWSNKDKDIKDILNVKPGGYGFPYTFTLILLYKFIALPFFPIIFQLGISLLTVIVFFKLILNMLINMRLNIFDKKIILIRNIVFLYFAYHPFLTIMAGLFYKDTILLFIVVLFLNILSRSKKILDILFASLLIGAMTFYRPLMGGMSFISLLLSFLYNKNQKIINFCGILFVFFCFMFINIKENILHGIRLFYSFNAYIESKNLALTGNVNLSFTKLLLLSLFSPMIPPPTIGYFPSPWKIIDEINFFGRVFQTLILPVVLIGIITFLYNFRKYKYLFPFFIFMLLINIGMIVTGIILTDRHKIMLYPIYGIFSILGLVKIFEQKFYKILYILLYFITINVVFFYNYLRAMSYGF